jgi:hypothetical protein
MGATGTMVWGTALTRSHQVTHLLMTGQERVQAILEIGGETSRKLRLRFR